MVEWQLYPKSKEITIDLKQVIEVFNSKHSEFNSMGGFELSSNEVLATLAEDLEMIGYKIEKSKSAVDKIKVPVLFGRNGVLEKSFDADGVNVNTKTVLEVEAGRAVVNNQFLKDLFQACMMHDIDNLIIAVRLYYRNSDFETVNKFFDTLYASGRLKLPLDKILIIGY